MSDVFSPQNSPQNSLKSDTQNSLKNGVFSAENEVNSPSNSLENDALAAHQDSLKSNGATAIPVTTTLLIESEEIVNDNTNNFISIRETDPDNPKAICLIDLINQKGSCVSSFLRVVRELPDEWIGLSEEEANRLFRPSRYHRMLRDNFWYEYDRSVSVGNKINLDRIWSGWSSYEYWKAQVKPKVVAYIMTPPVNLKRNLKYLFDLGMRRMEEILELPMYKEDGSPNTAVMNAILKVVDRVENRVLGPQTQKIEQTNKHLIATANIGQQQIDPLLLQRLKDEVEQNNQKIRGDYGTDEAIEVKKEDIKEENK